MKPIYKHGCIIIGLAILCAVFHILGFIRGATAGFSAGQKSVHNGSDVVATFGSASLDNCGVNLWPTFVGIGSYDHDNPCVISIPSRDAVLFSAVPNQGKWDCTVNAGREVCVKEVADQNQPGWPVGKDYPHPEAATSTIVGFAKNLEIESCVVAGVTENKNHDPICPPVPPVKMWSCLDWHGDGNNIPPEVIRDYYKRKFTVITENPVALGFSYCTLTTP